MLRRTGWCLDASHSVRDTEVVILGSRWAIVRRVRRAGPKPGMALSQVLDEAIARSGEIERGDSEPRATHVKAVIETAA